MTSPIALFVYNRPEHTKRTINALLSNSLAKSSLLYIFSDAARSHAEEKAVSEVRAYIKQISGFSKVTIIKRDDNWGLAASVIDGVTQLCEQHGRVIVLEDDLIVSPHFLSFMNAALDKYEKDDNVMQVAGYMFPVKLNIMEDCLFLSFISSWGWATWASAWEKFDPDAKGFDKLKNSNQLKHKFNLNGHYKYYEMLADQQAGKRESWAIRWYLSVFMNNGLTLYPKQTLVDNIGFDGSGENCVASTIETTSIDSGFKVVNLPDEVKLSSEYGEVLKTMPKPKLNIISIARLVLRKLTGRYK